MKQRHIPLEELPPDSQDAPASTKALPSIQGGQGRSGAEQRRNANHLARGSLLIVAVIIVVWALKNGHYFTAVITALLGWCLIDVFCIPSTGHEPEEEVKP